ncbi:putative membrane protein YeiB [Nonomuraea dietziae]|uniref:Putative membrane protein YeiB n=1 Tax=Nonomuraea dietziae TaxID=65515 RepID=A0A7W5Y4X7_9ACTN|nr:putative membrane protein YeiB [Nonomuraea dietziae]
MIGLLHMFLIWPGDVLAIYAASGLVFLLPSTWLPHRSRSGAAAPCQAAIHH